MKRLALIAVLVPLAAGCGTTAPERTVDVSGTVVAAAAGGGYTAGQAIDGANVSLRYQPPLQVGLTIRDTDATDAAGTFFLQAGPPAGQRDPSCSTLSVAATKVGFAGASLSLSSLCEGAGAVTVVIEMTPN